MKYTESINKKASKYLKNSSLDTNVYRLTGVLKKGHKDLYMYENIITNKTIFICNGKVTSI